MGNVIGLRSNRGGPATTRVRLRRRRAATAVETAMMLAVILMAALGAISALGIKNRDIWQFVGDTIGAVLL